MPSVLAVVVVHVFSPSSLDKLRRVTLIAANRSSSARTGTGLRRTRSLSRSQSAATAAYWCTTKTSTGRPGTVNIRIFATRSSIADMVLRLLAESFLYNLSGETPRRLATDLSQAIWWSPGAAWRSTPTRAATQRRSDWRCQGTPRLIPIVTNNVHSVEVADDGREHRATPNL
jgi:hypothetical protein